MAEYQKKTFECKASASRPKATIEWRNEAGLVYSSNTTTIITEWENVSSGLTEVKSNLSLLPDRAMNGKTLSCSGNNYLNEWHSDWITLNVTYPPDHPATIDGVQNGQNVAIIEDIRVLFTCTIGESNPPANVNWNCTDVTLYNVSDWNNTAKLLQIKASRKKSPVCSCSSAYLANNLEKVEVAFNVLYPATINKLLSNGLNISKTQLNLIENDTVHVRCDAEGNPSPTFRWTLQNEHYSYSQNITLDNVKRNNSTTRYTCIATNAMHDGISSYQGNDSIDFTLNVLYPPRIHALHNLRVIEGNSIYVNCTINPGNPSTPTDIRWTNSSGKESVLFINNVNRSDSRVYTCEANNTMTTSFGYIRFGIDNRSVYLDVLYPPEYIEVSLKTNNAIEEHIVMKFSLIESTSEIMILECSAKGNPMPSITWSGEARHGSSKLVLKVSRKVRGIYTCSASNTMITTEGTLHTGYINQTYDVDILYPPEVHLIERNVIEGEDVSISCVQTPGKVSHQSISWISHHTNITNSNSLIVRNVTRQHAGKGTCMVNYTMIPTYGESKSDSVIGVVYLDVLYKAELTNFFVVQNSATLSVTVNENDSVHMICILDSNPNSTMQIDVRNQTVSSGKLTKTLEQYISQSRCNDTGVYRCSGYNFLNKNGYLSWKELKLFVTCSPRRSSSFHVQQNVTVSLNDLATLKFNALAYPLPVFKWWRITYSILSEANNGNTNIHYTSENEFQVEFVISQIDKSDFGEYVLTLNNTFGSHQETFFLLQKDTTIAEQNHPDSEFAGPLAAGIIGSIIGIVAIVGAVALFRSRLHGTRLNAPNNSTTLNLSHVDQFELNDSYCSVTPESGIPNVYEQLQNSGADQQYQQLATTVFKENADVDCNLTADSGISNVYEKLHNAGSDQQYQQLKTFAVMDREEQRLVYENLRLQRNAD